MEQAIQDFLNSGAILGHSSKVDGKGQVLIGWGNFSLQAHCDATKLSVFAPDYFLTSLLPWIVYDNWITLDKVDLHRLLLPWALLFADEVHWQTLAQSEFQNDYEDLQRAIRSGELYKGVPYVFEKGTIQTGRSWRARTLINLLEQPETSRLYGQWNSVEGIIGATPEILFEFQGGPDDTHRLKTMALAGTQDIAEDPEEFLRDIKQVHEHRIVIEDIVERLRDLGETFLRPMRILELPRMRHLLTEIQVELKAQVEFEELARRLHPTPALGAFPRESGWRWLQKLEQARPRHRFGAPFGVCLADNLEVCLVAIRNVQWHNENLWLGAGCGVVQESRFEDEWDELHLKRESTKRMLGL